MDQQSNPPTDDAGPSALDWSHRAAADASLDTTTLIFDGHPPDQLACDTTLRAMPDGSWVMVMLGGGHTEPLPQNQIFLTRSDDRGKTWTPLTSVNLGIKEQHPTTATTLSELMVYNGRCTLFVASHDGTFANWKEWLTHSDNSCQNLVALDTRAGQAPRSHLYPQPHYHPRRAHHLALPALQPDTDRRLSGKAAVWSRRQSIRATGCS